MDSSCRMGYTLSPEALSVLEILLPIGGRERFIVSKEHLYFLLNLRRGYLGIEPMPAPRFQEIFHALISDPDFPKVSEVWSEDMKSRTLCLTSHGYSELRGSGRIPKE